MTIAGDAFRAFEHNGWNTPSVAVAYHRFMAELTRGCTPAVIAAAGLRRDEKVLDVACGPGYVAAAARERGAQAVGIDFSAAQIRVAEENYPDIRFVEGDAEALPFPDEEFDAVLNAFGMPHLSHPDKAATEARRTLKPGGRFVYASWCAVEKCVGFAMFYDAIRAHGTLDVGLPPGPNFFACGDPAYATAMLGKAGFADVSVREVPVEWRVPTPDGTLDVVLKSGVRAAAVLRAQTPENLAKIKQYLSERVSTYKRGDGYAVPTPALVVAAKNPG
jgi:SAM-dependent methyltransferase